jgi:hypothetical protein
MIIEQASYQTRSSVKDPILLGVEPDLADIVPSAGGAGRLNFRKLILEEL